ncbi:BTB/POZ domain-containing protein KCTD7-like [Littorina saxatilis]|uniref:BTB/POZ domain-containing protein KCTD7-like n=1 Tax=Littorina saxatilis TaxID=31220 RepID=UPI0038B5993C
MSAGVSLDDSASQQQFPDVIELNVGGRLFQTTLMTLTKDPNTMLGAMFSGKHRQPQDKDGRYFIDADGDTFAYILRYLRHGQFPPTSKVEEVHGSAVYFGLQDLVEELELLPQILIPKVRSGFLSHYNSINTTIKQILETAVKLSYTQPLSPRVAVIMCVRNTANAVYKERAPSHHCAFSGWPETSSVHSGKWDKRKADLLVGPLSLTSISEKLYVDGLVKEMVSRGYTVGREGIGNCNTGFETQGAKTVKGAGCGGELYRILLTWQLALSI